MTIVTAFKSWLSSTAIAQRGENKKEVEEAQAGDADSDCVFIPGPDEMKEKLRRVVQMS